MNKKVFCIFLIFICLLFYKEPIFAKPFCTSLYERVNPIKRKLATLVNVVDLIKFVVATIHRDPGIAKWGGRSNIWNWDATLFIPTLDFLRWYYQEHIEDDFSELLSQVRLLESLFEVRTVKLQAKDWADSIQELLNPHPHGPGLFPDDDDGDEEEESEEAKAFHSFFKDKVTEINRLLLILEAKKRAQKAYAEIIRQITEKCLLINTEIRRLHLEETELEKLKEALRQAEELKHIIDLF
jgi:hypothetical protein